MTESIRPNDFIVGCPVSELADLLAAGLLRLRSRKSSPNLPVEPDSLLDCEGSIAGDVAGKLEISRP